jgi:hypothetical protein
MDVLGTAVNGSAGFLDDLLAETEIKEETFDVVLHGGRVLKFKVINNYNQLQQLKKQAELFAKAAKKKGLIPEEYKDFWVNDAEALAMCKVLASTIVEPQLGDYEFMKLAYLRPLMFEHIKNEYNAGHAVKEIERDIEEQDAAKKE